MTDAEIQKHEVACLQALKTLDMRFDVILEDYLAQGGSKDNLLDSSTYIYSRINDLIDVFFNVRAFLRAGTDQDN
jgi:hypothetical protein